MKIKAVQKFIEKELKDLGVSCGSDAYKIIYDNAVSASEILTRAELKIYIKQYVESLPMSSFEE